MTVVVSPRLQSFMERRQCYMVRDYIRHIHIVPVTSHNTLIDRKPSHQSLTSYGSEIEWTVTPRGHRKSSGASHHSPKPRSKVSTDPSTLLVQGKKHRAAAREPTWHVVASRLSTAAREGIEHVSDVQPSRKKPLVSEPTRVQTMRASDSFHRDSFTEASERLPGPSL